MDKLNNRRTIQVWQSGNFIQPNEQKRKQSLQAYTACKDGPTRMRYQSVKPKTVQYVHMMHMSLSVQVVFRLDPTSPIYSQRS